MVPEGWYLVPNPQERVGWNVYTTSSEKRAESDTSINTYVVSNFSLDIVAYFGQN